MGAMCWSVTGDSAALATGDQLATAMPPAIQMVNANGAGDAMAAALFSAMLASRHVRPNEKDTGKLLETALAAGARHSETRWTIIMIPMRFSNETDAARQAGTPLVALESTLISHGLPHPDNIDVAHRAEEAVRVPVPHLQPWPCLTALHISVSMTPRSPNWQHRPAS